MLGELKMPHDELDELVALLARSRQVLDHYLVDEKTETMRDDVAQICMAIDDALPDPARVTIKIATRLERTAGDVAA
jgi:hypothetical protein